MYWNPEVLTRIDAADDLKIAPYHPDMNTTEYADMDMGSEGGQPTFRPSL